MVYYVKMTFEISAALALRFKASDDKGRFTHTTGRLSRNYFLLVGSSLRQILQL
jgi:hypothetical protein